MVEYQTKMLVCHSVVYLKNKTEREDNKNVKIKMTFGKCMCFLLTKGHTTITRLPPSEKGGHFHIGLHEMWNFSWYHFFSETSMELSFLFFLLFQPVV